MFLEVRPIEVSFNKRQWDTLLGFIAASLNNNPIPESCRVHYTSPMPAPPPQPPIAAYYLRFVLNSISVCGPMKALAGADGVSAVGQNVPY